MNVIDNASLPLTGLTGIEHRTLAGSRDGLSHLSVWQQVIAPGAATPPHCHDCEEVVLITAGRGRLHLAGAVHEFGPDTTLVVPPNAPHQIFNVGVEPLELVGVLSVAPVAVFLPDGQPLDLPWAS